MHDVLVASARQILDAGRGLDAVLAELDAAQLGTIHRILVLREGLGLGLRDAVAILEAARSERPLAHLNRGRLERLQRVHHAAQRPWWTEFYCEAVLGLQPWLTLVPAPESAPGRGVVHSWRCPEVPPDALLWSTPERHEDLLRRLAEEPNAALASFGLLCGEGVSFERLRSDLRSLREVDPFWREHAVPTRDTDAALTCRFHIDP